MGTLNHSIYGLLEICTREKMIYGLWEKYKRSGFNGGCVKNGRLVRRLFFYVIATYVSVIVGHPS
jgi:hypothetical protein